MKTRRQLMAWLGAIVAAPVCAPALSAAQISVGSGLRVDRPARTLKDLRDQRVIRQRFDFSCGAAALATILHYGFDDPVTEVEILQQLFSLLDDEELVAVRRTGFSLLHLQRVAQARGYRAQGFRLSPDQVPRLGGPVIVFIEPRGYAHFAVLRGVRADRVYLADPSRGNIRVPAHAFRDSWLQDDERGIIFVVEPASASAIDTGLAVNDDSSGLPERMTVEQLLSVGAPLLRSGPLPSTP